MCWTYLPPTIHQTMQYTITKESVDRASSPGFIDQIGAYTGTFTQAYEARATTGAIGIAFDFQDDAGQRARWTLWTHRADGTAIFGEGQMASMLACMKLRSIDSRPGTAKVYDFDQGALVEKDVEVYPDLLNRPIGVFLQSEEYEKRDGETGVRMVPVGFFQVGTRLVAKEIMDRITTASQYDSIVARLKHRPLRDDGGARPAARSTSASSSASSSIEDMDDDIPF